MSPAVAAPHVPVLLDEVVAALDPRPGEIHVDGTFGAGGYTKAILNSGARVVAFDRDPDAIHEGSSLVDGSGGALTLVPERFSRMGQALAASGVQEVDGVTLDIGVSSMQLDRAERGFSFQSDGPLDMRMSRKDKAPPTSSTAPPRTRSRTFSTFMARSRNPAASRGRSSPRARSSGRASLRTSCARPWPQAGMKKDPATRTFQAIRIYLNEELQELEGGLEAAEQVLKSGGRLAVVTFHSLEDRVVKRFLRERSGAVPAASRHLPVQAHSGPAPTFEGVAKPVRASDDEVRANPRARSATLRVARRTSASPWSPAYKGMPS
jgi:16S rRNA (cytosine1402-N4)-methyltransferase